MRRPEQLGTPEGRRAALEEAKRRIEERKGRAISEEQSGAEVEVDPELVLGRDKRVVGGGASGLGLRAASSNSSGSARRGQSRAIARIACSRRSAASRRVTGSIWLPTRPTSSGGRGSATRLDVY
jgi:hypothetical protein